MKKAFLFWLFTFATAATYSASIQWNSAIDFVDSSGNVQTTSDGYTFVLACIGDGSGVDYSTAYSNIRSVGNFSYDVGEGINSIEGLYTLVEGADINGNIYAVLAKSGNDLFYLDEYGMNGHIGTYTLSGFEDVSSKVAPFDFGNASGNGFVVGGKVESVPEPTSGLLVLMGLAGLMLRRKHA